MITYRVGDLFQDLAEVQVNTVNCVGVMGKGVALGFKQKYPRLYLDFRRACTAHQITPGCIWVYPIDGRFILNMATKNHWREPSQYPWVHEGLTTMRQFLTTCPANTEVAMPLPGCGNGGLNPTFVGQMIENIMQGVTVSIRIYTNPV